MDIQIVHTRELNPNIKPYLVDVPVKTNVWIRPTCQKAQFEVLRQARPSVLFVQSDGGRNDQEWELIYQNRRLFDECVDWDCTIHKIYADKNYGMYRMWEITEKHMWKYVDRSIFLEDDHIPAVSFVRFCAEMLERYRDDLRVHAICGMNQLGVNEKTNSDYFFSHVGSIWGIAYWKRTQDSFALNYKDNPYVIDEVCNIAKKDTSFCESIKGYAKGEKIGGHVPGPEFYLVLNMYAQNQLFLVATKNMISCHGAEPGSAHATNSIKKMAKGDAQLFYSKTYELGEKIRHPQYVFPDLTYEKCVKRVMAYSWCHPMVRFYRNVVGIVKRIYYGDGKEIIKKIPKKIKKLTGHMEYEK